MVDKRKGIAPAKKVAATGTNDELPQGTTPVEGSGSVPPRMPNEHRSNSPHHNPKGGGAPKGSSTPKPRSRG